MSITPFKGQVYEDLKSAHNSSDLFEDPEFPATNSSIFFSQTIPRGVRWRRPKEVMSDPKFEVDGFGRADLDQGYVGNCWFIAGCVGIMQSDKLFAKVVPHNQSFDDDDYAGIFHFRFWLYGEWVDVVIDDRLPFYPDGRLVFCSNKQGPSELWGPLLEKAYAKIYGSYEALEGGFTTDALIDMSGGIEETFELKSLDSKLRQDFFTILFQSYNKNSIIGCSINADPSVREARQSNGLVKGHAYTVTKVAIISSDGSDIRLIRCRNPWGNEVEWKGAWSDGSREWNRIDESQKEELGMVHDHDGEFWMSYEDFISNWDTVQICHLTCDSFSDELLQTSEFENFSWRTLNSADMFWQCTTYQSEWARGSTAGGCGQPNMAKFWINPQFLVTVDDVDKYDDENKATVIIALMQKDTRLKRQETGGEAAEEYIQFRVFRIKDDVSVDSNKSTGLRFYSSQLERIATSGSYINKREVTKRIKVSPGNYLIIPSTYDEDRDCKFMLRVFTEKPIESGGSLEEHKENLDEQDIFFEATDLDQAFSSWNSLIGPGDDSPRGSPRGRSRGNSDSNERPTVQEECQIM